MEPFKRGTYVDMARSSIYQRTNDIPFLYVYVGQCAKKIGNYVVASMYLNDRIVYTILTIEQLYKIMVIPEGQIPLSTYLKVVRHSPFPVSAVCHPHRIPVYPETSEE